MFNSKNSIIFAAVVIICSIATFSFECNCSNSNKDETEQSKNSIKKIANTNDDKIESEQSKNIIQKKIASINDEKIENYLSEKIKPENITPKYIEGIKQIKEKIKSEYKKEDYELLMGIIDCSPTDEYIEVLASCKNINTISMARVSEKPIEINKLKAITKILDKFSYIEGNGHYFKKNFLEPKYTNEQLEALSELNCSAIANAFINIEEFRGIIINLKAEQIKRFAIIKTAPNLNFNLINTLVEKLKRNDIVTDQEILDSVK